jgi:hypothetical protein
MGELLVVSSVAGTTLAGWWFGRYILELSGVRFVSILAATLECLGMTVIFVLLNVVLGAVCVLAIRGLTTSFVSLYMFSDLALVLLSLLQGLAFRWWWQLA